MPPTGSPTALPTPSPTVLSTWVTEESHAGEKNLAVKSIIGFPKGHRVRITGGGNTEVREIKAHDMSDFVFVNPLVHSYPVGSNVMMTSHEPQQSDTQVVVDGHVEQGEQVVIQDMDESDPAAVNEVMEQVQQAAADSLGIPFDNITVVEIVGGGDPSGTQIVARA